MRLPSESVFSISHEALFYFNPASTLVNNFVRHKFGELRKNVPFGTVCIWLMLSFPLCYNALGMGKVIRFIFWEHVKETLWAFGIILFISIFNWLGLIYPSLNSFFQMSIQTYSIIDNIISPIGILSFVMTIVSYALYRKRYYSGNVGRNF